MVAWQPHSSIGKKLPGDVAILPPGDVTAMLTKGHQAPNCICLIIWNYGRGGDIVVKSPSDITALSPGNFVATL